THLRLGAMPPGGLPGRAFLLETPIDNPGDDRRNVAKLWELAGLSVEAPPAEKGFSMLTAAIKKIQAKTAKSAKAAARKTKAAVKAKAATGKTRKKSRKTKRG
ncbi:MAG: hypothetical protein ACRD51_11425, partial [Candidatus Acidiferrum sp.]